MYFACARYRFIELVQGTTFFEDSNGSGKADEWLETLQSDMMQQRAMEETVTGFGWLEELRGVTSPRISAQIQKIVSDDEIRKSKAFLDYALSESILPPIENSNLSEAPPEFEKTLSLLRCVIENETWPKIAGARSRVIRTVGTGSGNRGNPSPAKGATTTPFPGELFQSGSFTVVNEEKYTGKLPLGNELFPELVKAVFELEGELSASPRSFADGDPFLLEQGRFLRIAQSIGMPSLPLSVDSGRGQGQSVSMIVGLGDFNRGSIFVEGEPYSIRYNPSDFDGWKQLHWAEPFQS
jgi:hypothetical protein